jgi:protease-4
MNIDTHTKQEFSRAVLYAALALAVFAAGLGIWGMWYDEWSGYNASSMVSDGTCNIAVIPIVGDIYTGMPTSDGSDGYPVANADDVVAAISAAEADEHIDGIMVRIDSTGGTPVASELIAHAIKSSFLPSVALIREYGDSGAYLAASAADTVIASPFSDIGSIGITMSYLDNAEQNIASGLHYNQLSSGRYKDIGNPDKALTSAERALLERDLQIYHDEFVKQVAANRGLPEADIAALADGSSMPGALALEHKLIDALGDKETARALFAEQWGVSVDEVIFCE